MNDIPKKGRGRPRSVKSQQAILQATIELLGKVGFERLSIEAIAKHAQVGKTTIYRRYKSKEELVADAIESLRSEIVIPDTGSLWSDLDSLVKDAAQISLSAMGRKTVGAIISTASNNSQFAQIYQAKYLQPRRQAFAVILARAKARKEIRSSIDGDLIFDLMSGIMLYALLFPASSESWETYIQRALRFLLKEDGEVQD
jgi:AcrR family transcriptional regulator